MAIHSGIDALRPLMSGLPEQTLPVLRLVSKDFRTAADSERRCLQASDPDSFVETKYRVSLLQICLTVSISCLYMSGFQHHTACDR